MSSSEDEFPCVRATIVRDPKAEAKAKEVKADAEARAKAIAEFVADEEDADFTQHYREKSIRNSRRLSAMATKSSGDRVRATAYLGVGMKAAEKRKKKLKKVESVKKQKQKDSKKLQKVVESLFAMRSPATKSPTSTSTPTQECRRDFDPVSIQAFASTSPKGTTPTNRSSVNVTTPSTVSSIATTSITNDTNFICRGCGNTASLCHEVKYRNFCLHAVMDYFELVGMDFSTQHGITDAFTVAYTSAVKKDLLDRHQFYERNREVELPDCIERGALQDALYLRSSRRLLQFLLNKRVYDIPSHLQDMTDGSVEHRVFPDYEQS